MLDIRGILFDLDGVIADTHPLHEQSWGAVLAEAGRTMPRLQLAPLVRSGRTRGEMTEAFFPDLDEESRRQLGRRKDELFASRLADLQPMAGVIGWIQELARKAVPLGVATSASKGRAEAILTAFGIAKLFSVVITAEDVAHGKPDPALFRTAGERLAVEPAHLLVVEDSQAGLTAAHAAGMRCLFYGPLPEGRDSHARPPEFHICAFTREQLTDVMRHVFACSAEPA